MAASTHGLLDLMLAPLRAGFNRVSSMRSIFLILLAVACLTSGFGDSEVPAWAATPDDPGAKVPPARYSSVMAGTKAFRPVEPMQWGEVNRRVAPKPPQKPTR